MMIGEIKVSVTIRLSRHGRKGIPFYRVVAADKARARDGRYLELLGTINPLTEPATVSLKEDRIKYWIGVGAQTSDTVSQVIESRMPGYLSGIETSRVEKVRSQRAKRKARAGKVAKPSKAAKPAKKS